MSAAWSKVQWDVVWSVLRTLLVAGGPVATLLVALGFPPVQVSADLGIGLAVVAILSVVVPGLKGALNRTDSSKVAAVKALPPEAQARVADQLPNDTKIAAVAAIPDVAKVIVRDTATNGTAAVAADPSQPKVVKQSET